jgi:ABC-type bacteriocin/lantibiotic exporter with double-glycine peptidase domain
MESKDKSRLLFISLISIANGIFSVIGIASILPFIGVISEPDLINTQPEIIAFKDFTGIESYRGIILTFGSVSFLLVLIGNIVNGLDIWIANLFGLLKEQQLSQRLLSIYLSADDQIFNRQKNAERAKYILADIDRVILDSLFAMLEMFSGVVVALFIFLLLIVVDPMATLVISAAILIIYFSVYGITSRRLDRLGKEYADLETDIYEEVLQALKLQREIKLAQKQSFFIGHYSQAFAKMVKNRLRFELISLVPQGVIEVVAYGSILMLAIYFSLAQQSNYSAITLIGMYAFATYRMMPAISDIFDSFEKIQFGSAILQRLVSEFDPEPAAPNDTLVSRWKTLTLENIGFTYHGQTQPVLNNINMNFIAGQFYCIAGQTGCGKSTLLNIIAGLYQTNSGNMKIDQKVTTLYHNIAWQTALGYVPTDVQLINGSLLENIMLCEEDEAVDLQRVEEIAQTVALDETLAELSKGYHTRLGDGNQNLSSGQMQKVGLARALYRKPRLLLLDESTDAFDLASEKRILDNLRQSFKTMTIIFVSHRPSVMSQADQVIDLQALKANSG